MKCLFIGGHAAGKMIDVDERRTWIRVAIPNRTPAEFSDLNSASVEWAAEEIIYHRERVTSKTGRSVWVFVSEDCDCALEALMDFYINNPHPEAK